MTRTKLMQGTSRGTAINTRAEEISTRIDEVIRELEEAKSFYKEGSTTAGKQSLFLEVQRKLDEVKEKAAKLEGAIFHERLLSEGY